jgi:hypothetical protein
VKARPFILFVFRLLLIVPTLLLLLWALYEFGAPKLATYMAPRFVPLSAVEEEAFARNDAAQRKKWFDEFVGNCADRTDLLPDTTKEQRVQVCTRVRDQNWRTGYVVPRLVHPSELHQQREIEPRIGFIRQTLVPGLIAILAIVTFILFLRHLCKLTIGIDLIPWLPIDPPGK